MGVSKPVTTSAGGIYTLPIKDKQVQRLEARRRRYQRIMARKRTAALRSVGWDGKSTTRAAAEKKLAQRQRDNQVQGEAPPPRYSRRYEISKRQHAKTTKKLVNIRHNALHHISSEISRDNAMIFIEDLAIKNMTATAKGDTENPGRNVRAKAGLNREILARGWGSLSGMLKYKSDWRGGCVETVPPAYTSQKCSKCGHTDKQNRKTQANFTCLQCGYRDDADINAAKNILAQGLGATARGDSDISRSVKREPATINAEKPTDSTNSGITRQ